MFFVIPVGVDYRADRCPVVTFTLIGINVTIFLLTFVVGIFGGIEARIWELSHLWLIPAKASWWTFITSGFVHSGLLHLIGNMVYLFLFGACVEDLIGRARFVLFYLIGLLSAGLLHVLLTPAGLASTIPMGGASGAISACIGAFLLLLAKTRVEFRWIFFLIFRVWSGQWFIPAWVVISFWFLGDFAGLVGNWGEGAQGGGVAFAAHVGGTLSGIAMMAIRKFRTQTAERELPDKGPRLAAIQSYSEPATLYLYANGQQMGPFSRTQVTQMQRLGSVDPETLYWEDGMPEWRPVSELS